MSHSNITVENMKTIIIKKYYKNHPLTRVSDGTFGCMEEEIGGACGTNGSQ
jgi:hypothetical protein